MRRGVPNLTASSCASRSTTAKTRSLLESRASSSAMLRNSACEYLGKEGDWTFQHSFLTRPLSYLAISPAASFCSRLLSSPVSRRSVRPSTPSACTSLKFSSERSAASASVVLAASRMMVTTRSKLPIAARNPCTRCSRLCALSSSNSARRRTTSHLQAKIAYTLLTSRKQWLKEYADIKLATQL